MPMHVLVCLLAAILVLALKLYKRFVYRLAPLPGSGVAGIGRGRGYADHSNKLHQESTNLSASVCRDRMDWFALRVEETAFYNVGDISPLLFCGVPQESEEA